MITITNVDTYNWENALRGMRHPKLSYEKIDSEFDSHLKIGQNDMKLAMQLVQGGPVHRKYLRQILVSMDITAPMYWWKEFDTYKVGTTANSTSTMHKIHTRDISIEDFSYNHLNEDSKKVLQDTIDICNKYRKIFIETKDKEAWYQMIQLLPSSYNQTRTVTLNYEVLANMYQWRHNHKLDEWREFCAIVKQFPYAKQLIIGEKPKEVDIVKMAEEKIK